MAMIRMRAVVSTEVDGLVYTQVNVSPSGIFVTRALGIICLTLSEVGF